MVQAVQLTQDVQIVQVVQPLRGACPEKALTKRDLTEKDEYVVERYGFFRLLQRAATHPSMLNRAIRRNKRFENRRANMVMKRRMMHEREWEMMYPSRLFRVDHLPVNDMIKSGFILQPTVVGMSIRNEARLLANSCNFFRLRMRIINRSKYVLTINGFVRTHKTQQHPLPKKFRNKKRG